MEKYLRARARRLPALAALAALILLSTSGCEPDLEEEEEEGETPRAHLEVEDGLAVLHLTSEEESSLGLRLAAAESGQVAEEVLLAAWAAPRPGGAAVVRAPAAGYLEGAEEWPIPGRAVEKNGLLAMLRPFISPSDRLQVAAFLSEVEKEAADLERDLARARAALEVAAIQLERARRLLTESAVSKKALEEAVFQQAAAAADLRAAEEKRAALAARRRLLEESFHSGAGANGGAPEPSGAPIPLPVRSSLGGRVTAVLASPGEYVEAGRALFEVADLDPVWLRVPVFEGELPLLDLEAGIAVMAPGAPASGEPLSARLVARRPAADPQTRSVDLFFELPNADLRLLAGQSAAVRARRQGTRAAVTVPAGAIILDASGGAWVYVARGERKYTRRRVEAGAWSGGRVEVRRGLAAGEQVVAAGAAELFGSEFGAGGE